MEENTGALRALVTTHTCLALLLASGVSDYSLRGNKECVEAQFSGCLKETNDGSACEACDVYDGYSMTSTTQCLRFSEQPSRLLKRKDSHYDSFEEMVEEGEKKDVDDGKDLTEE